MKLSVTDLSDAHPDASTPEPLFRDFGGLEAFHGQIETLKVFEDNGLVRESLEQPGQNRVLVVDGGGSRRCALVGGNLASLAVTNGWQGIVVYGYVRDCGELRVTAVGIKALGVHPRKSAKGLHTGQRGLTVNFAGTAFVAGHWLYADPDGILVSEHPLHPA